MIVEIISIAFGVAGILVGCYSWWHAARWTRALQETRLAIAYKRKVKRNHSFAEWLKYATALTGDLEKGGGNVVYSLSGTQVAVFRAPHKKRQKPATKSTPTKPTTKVTAA